LQPAIVRRRAARSVAMFHEFVSNERMNHERPVNGFFLGV
jgi:hypothetical protein